MNKVLIANRGEVAVRLIRACREYGAATVAVYSEADASAPFVSLADEAYPLGGSTAAESYLRGDVLLAIARESGADALHPGYGFLSENAAFAQACRDAGLVWVGPSPDVIRQLGDKIGAKQRMAAASVPVVPGYSDEDQSDARLTAEAQKIGTPLLIKASAGGGGRGMRVVSDAADFLPLLTEARREAQAAFGDERVLLERYVASSRHIEFQIFGDTHGRVVHLFERDCSIQRRHQKIIEESPSPVLTPDVRAAMAEAAVRAGEAVGYTNAGTVEFLFEEDANGAHRFYFLEVNARLQVEHPVTEGVTGMDLAHLQLIVADGQPLPFAQPDLSSRGHAIEVRIYAENPAAGFLPSLGTLHRWQPPVMPGVRVDSGVEAGGEVSPYYDPMLAKLIVQGTTRRDALRRLEAALADFVVLGVETNIPYLLAIVRHPLFQAGTFDTRFLSAHFADWQPPQGVPRDVWLACAADALLPRETARTAAPTTSGPASPWHDTQGWRNVPRHAPEANHAS